MTITTTETTTETQHILETVTITIHINGDTPQTSRTLQDKETARIAQIADEEGAVREGYVCRRIKIEGRVGGPE